MRTNILLINHYAGSPHHGMEYRPYYLSREWVQAGHSVRILAGAFSHVRSRQPSIGNTPIKQLTIEIIDGIEYVWYPTPSYQGNGFGRFKNICSFLKQVWLNANRIVAEFKPNVVIASSTYPMDIWVAKRIAQIANAKLVFEVHDLWPLSPIELGGMSPYHPFIMLCQRAENKAYHDADVVISMLPKVHEHMSAHGLDISKLRIVPNGIALDDWSYAPTPLSAEFTETVSNLRSRNELLVGYAGSHGIPNALDALLDAAALLRDEPFQFLLVGDGHERDRLVKRVADEGLDQVTMMPPIPKTQIRALLACFDIAYMGAPRSPIYRFGVMPNKLLDYMMAGVPVLYAVEAGNNLVAEAGSGISVRAEHPEEIADALRCFVKLHPEERRAIGLRGHLYVRDRFVYRNLAHEFIKDLCI